MIMNNKSVGTMKGGGGRHLFKLLFQHLPEVNEESPGRTLNRRPGVSHPMWVSEIQ